MVEPGHKPVGTVVSPEHLKSRYERLGKRLLDLAGALSLFALLSPLGLLVACLALLFQGRPILFFQQRPGVHGRPFWLIKFRTMRPQNDSGTGGSDTERLTRFGRLLRSTSFDEIPQLVNVAKGEMSLVGPRPLLMDYLPRYSEEQHRRHEVLPGITGWSQIHGRNRLSWSERLAMDVWYVDNLSVGLDLRILLATVREAIKREGITEEGQATKKKFQGDQSGGSSIKPR